MDSGRIIGVSSMHVPQDSPNMETPIDSPVWPADYSSLCKGVVLVAPKTNLAPINRYGS